MEIQNFVDIQPDQEIYKYWEKSLFNPINDLLSRPRKEIRSQLPEIGFLFFKKEISKEELIQLQAVSFLVETLHTGSLIIDDIQDHSHVRRGGPCLHEKYGIELSINAGNWLYFFAFEPVLKLTFPPEKKLLLFQAVQKTLLQAHYGQALDLSVVIDREPRESIPLICQKSLELKSGALMGLGFELGGLLTQASTTHIDSLRSFGVELGIVLQMFDDLGNFNLKQPTEKHLEDLKNKRPSYLWWFLAEQADPNLLAEFKVAMNTLPNITLLNQFIEKHSILDQAHQKVWTRMTGLIEKVKAQFPDATPAIKKMEQIGERLSHAYK